MQLNTLGSLRLTDGTLTRPKPLLLLAYLALEGPKPRRYIAELFFADTRDPADALSTTLRRLRREGDDLVQAADGFMSTPLRCDARHVLDLLDGDQLHEAVTLHTAPFLSSLHLSLPPELEEWVYATREHVAGRIRTAALAAAEAALDEADTEEATRCAQAAITLQGAPEPEPEELRRLHHILLETHPHHAARVRQEAKELGLVLDAKRSRHPPSPVPPVHPLNPPVPLSPLVGRDVELLDIARALTKDDCRLLCLHGPGGVGKTRLAMQAAYEQKQYDTFRERIAFVALEALTLPTQIPHAIAATLTLPPLTAADPWAELAERIGADKLLLVLDNFEHLNEAAPRLPHLLTACPGLVLLVTSRERLNLASEWVLTLDGLPVPQRTLDLEHASLTDALDLFLQRAKRSHLSFTLRPTDLTHAITICEAVDGFPLGLELAASWVQAMPLADIAETLSRDPTELDVTLRDVRPRHRSLHAVMEHSWLLLSRDDRDVLRRLAVFYGGFRRQAASTVAGASIAHLRRLVDASLLRMTAAGRYERHVLLHQFTQQKLAEHPQEKALARERHCTYYIGQLQDASARAGAADFQEVFALLEEEEGNLLACLDWAIAETRSDALLALADPLLWYFPMRGRFHEGAAIFARAIAGLDEEDPASQESLAAYALGQSFLARFAGNLEQALDLALKAERIARASGSKRQLVQALNILGQAITFTGQYEEANELLSEAVDLARDARDTTLLFRGLGNLIVSMALIGTYAPASELAREALEILDEGRIRDGFEVLGVLLAVGVLHTCRGDWPAAHEILHRAVVMSDHVKYVGPASVLKALLANALLGLAEQNADPHLLDRATREIVEGAAMAASSEEGMAQSLLHGLQSRLSLHRGSISESERLAVLATSVAWKNRNTTIIFWTLPQLANVYLAANRAGDARLLSNLMMRHPASPHWVKEHGASVHRALGQPRAESDNAPTNVDTMQPLEIVLRHLLRETTPRVNRHDDPSQ